ncbi:MAG: MMPL family transporter, partial [Gemmatimonadetes bacterium]|nr:MMPL family transporter [Gemmatimonadota bacterium]
RQFIERLGAKIEAARVKIPVAPGSKEKIETNLYARIFYKGDLKMLGAKALLFVPEDKLVELQKKLEEYRPLIQPFTQTTNLISLISLVNNRFTNAKREQSAENDALVKALPALERIFVQATASLKRGGVPPSPGVFALFDPSREAEQSVYITYADGQIYLATAQPLNSEVNSEAVRRMRQLLAETKREVPGVNAGLTGESVLELDELQQSQKDTTLASIVALLICAAIFIYGYHETGRPLKATACLVIGVGYTMGFTTLVVGHLNILTITFVPILIGIAIDFGVHLVTRYEEELRHGATEENAIKTALVFTGQGIFTGAFTTAGAFLATAPWPRASSRGEADAADFERIRAAVQAIRQVRAEYNVQPGAWVEATLVAGSGVSGDRDAVLAALTAGSATVGALSRARVSAATDAPTGAAAHVIIDGGIDVIVPLAGMIDLAKERQRVETELAQLEKQIGALEGRLANAAFVDKAPPAVVEAERAKLADWTSRAAQLRAKLASLGA